MLKRHVRHSKYDPLEDELELIEANPQYAHVRYLNGRETTVSIRHLAPAGSEPSSVQPPEHIRNDDPVRIPQHNIPPVTLSSNNDSEHQKSNYTPDNTPIIDNAPAIDNTPAILKSTRTLNAPIDDIAPVIAEPRRSTRERRLPARFIQEM